VIPTILACWFCLYQELGVRWTMGALAPTERGIRLRVGEVVEPYRIADLSYDGESWRYVLPADWKEAKRRPSARGLTEKRCIAAIPYHPLSREQAIALRPHLRVGHSVAEAPESCVEAEGKLWFGLGFYEGEGEDGIGGVGMYDQHSKRIEVHRPVWLRDKSITAIAHDGRYLWLAVTRHYERSDESHGLARYDWTTDEVVPMRGLDAPCGLSVADLLIDRGTLWVSADLLSRRDLSTGTWSHFALAPDGGTPRQASCRGWYRRVLDTSDRAWRTSCQPLCDDRQVAEQIAEADPELTREHLLARKHLHWAETVALGSLLRTFDELTAALPRAMDDEARHRLLLAFSETRNRDPRWRDFALEEVKRRPHDLELLRHFRGDERVFAYLTALATGGAESDNRNAVEMLPWLDAARARPLLRALMAEIVARKEPAKGEIDLLAEAIEAMERASHLRIQADGTRTRLAANSDTPEYADEEFGAFSHKRNMAELRPIAELWLKEP
jgi:hypothetical protein